MPSAVRHAVPAARTRVSTSKPSSLREEWAHTRVAGIVMGLHMGLRKAYLPALLGGSLGRRRHGHARPLAGSAPGPCLLACCEGKRAPPVPGRSRPGPRPSAPSPEEASPACRQGSRSMGFTLNGLQLSALPPLAAALMRRHRCGTGGRGWGGVGWVASRSSDARPGWPPAGASPGCVCGGIEDLGCCTRPWTGVELLHVALAGAALPCSGGQTSGALGTSHQAEST